MLSGEEIIQNELLDFAACLTDKPPPRRLLKRYTDRISKRSLSRIQAAKFLGWSLQRFDLTVKKGLLRGYTAAGLPDKPWARRSYKLSDLLLFKDHPGV